MILKCVLNYAKCGIGFWDNLCAYDCYVNIMWVCPIVNASACRLLGAYDLGVATLRAVVYVGDKNSGDARYWYMISGDAKSWIMPPTMMTRSNGWPAAASRGGGTGRRADRGGSRTRGRSCNQVDSRNDGLGGQIGGQGSEVNGGVDAVHDFSTIIAQELQN
ncbi:hypothetical protein Tco_1100633, partial [Tanacetum coccineum]